METAADTDEQQEASTRRPTLYILRLHESPILNEDDYERFSWQWILTQSGNDVTIQAGDLVCFPELCSGAGEFEGLRFVGNQQETTSQDDRFPLWSAGIEAPEFPAAIVDLQPQGSTLRDGYEGLFNAMLSEVHGGMTLEDLFGGEDVVNEFWSSPDLARLRKTSDQEWLIPLEQCTFVKTIT